MNVFERKSLEPNHLRNKWNENITQNKGLTRIAIKFNAVRSVYTLRTWM
jgi:hypothetical protein